MYKNTVEMSKLVLDFLYGKNRGRKERKKEEKKKG